MRAEQSFVAGAVSLLALEQRGLEGAAPADVRRKRSSAYNRRQIGYLRVEIKSPIENGQLAIV